MFLGGVDGAGSHQVLDGGTIGVAERSAELCIGGIVEGEDVAAAVENALECIVGISTRMSAHHAADADVSCHEEVLAIVALA